MDVSDGPWQHFQKMPLISYIYWNFGLVVIDMDVFDVAWQPYQQCHGSFTDIAIWVCDNWHGCFWRALAAFPKNAMDPLHILEFPVVIIYMDVSDGLWQHDQQCNACLAYIWITPGGDLHGSLWWGMTALPTRLWIHCIYWDSGSWSLTIVSLMGLGNITEKAIDLKRIFELCFVMIVTDVSDTAWHYCHTRPGFSYIYIYIYIYWNFALW